MKFNILIPLFFLIFSCSNKDEQVIPLLHFVPENAFAIVKIENHQAFLSTIDTNDFLSELKATNTFKNIHEKVRYLKYLSPKSESILALTETSDNQFEFIYVTETSDNLIHLDSVKNKKIDTVEIGNSTYGKYTIENTSFYSLVVGQKVVISSSNLLLEQLNGTASANQPEALKKLFDKNDKNKPASIFIDLNTSHKMLSSILKKDSEIKLSGFTNWIALDFNETAKHLNFSGVSIANKQRSNYIDLFANTKPISNAIASYAPARADAILSYTFDDYAVFARNRELSSSIVSPVDPPMSSVEEIGVIYLDAEKAIVLNTYGADGISEYLRSQKKEVVEYQGQEIVKLGKTDFLNNRFSPIVKNYSANFYVLLNNAFIFSETENLIKSIISSYKNGSTFNKTSVFTTLKDEIAQESSILFISNSKDFSEILKNDLSADFSKDLEKVALSKFGIAAQAIADKGFYHTNFVVQKIENEVNPSTNSTQVFNVKLEAELATDPQYVTNHLTGKKEIIVQDQNNVLYLISSTGKILWKKQLGSLVQGKIKQVDIFKNGRLQLAFTTNNQFLVLDRNGKEVSKFTKTFEGGNLNPLAVFDYDNKKNYRFVVTQMEKTFMYDNKAAIVKGFKYTKAEQPIIAAPKHIVISNKDFLVFKLKDGSLKLLSRVGDVRIEVAEKIDFSDNEVFRYKNKFSVTDKKGVLHQVDLDGKLTKTNFNLSNDHGMAATDNTLVLMNDNILTIKGKKVELELGVYSQPKIFYIYNKIYVSVTDLQNEQIYVFDSQAKSVGSFPLHGSSVIDIADMDGKKGLEVVSKDSSTSILVHSLN